MPEDEPIPEAEIDRMIEAALGGLTPQEALIQNSRDDAAKVAERQAAIAKNRERARKLLEAIEKSQGKA